MKRGAELLELEFVYVERIGPLGAARFRVIQLVGGGNDQLAGWGKHPAGLLQEAAPVFQVLDHFESHYQVETGAGEGKCAARGLFETEIRLPVISLGELDGFGRDIHAALAL